MEHTQTDTPKDSKQNKVRRITIRLTEQEYSELTENAAACGMHKSTYAHDRLIGQPPHLLMTDEQAEHSPVSLLPGPNLWASGMPSTEEHRTSVRYSSRMTDS